MTPSDMGMAPLLVNGRQVIAASVELRSIALPFIFFSGICFIFWFRDESRPPHLGVPAARRPSFPIKRRLLAPAYCRKTG
jgi:hypothetical protein